MSFIIPYTHYYWVGGPPKGFLIGLHKGYGIFSCVKVCWAVAEEQRCSAEEAAEARKPSREPYD